MAKVDIFQTNSKYEILYSDPPWNRQKGGLRKCRPNQGRKLDYETLSVSEIMDIHRQAFSLMETRHNVFLWTIDKYLWDAEQMMDEAGYLLHARMIWDKENGVAPAFTVRYSHEYLLWFYPKGKMLMPDKAQRGVFTTVFRERAKKHSQKPEFAYDMLEKMFPNSRKLELFARNQRLGWDCWGNEV